jgi:hypothetical protein
MNLRKKVKLIWQFWATILLHKTKEPGSEVAAQPRRAPEEGLELDYDLRYLTYLTLPSVVSKRLVIDRYLAETKRLPY